jgi:eukaryotic-like serine/threonine-protein kinase
VDIGIDAGGPYLVMEQMMHGTLAEWGEALYTTSLTPAHKWHQLCHYLVATAEQVGTLHAKGIVHRDLKPDNVFLAGRYVRLGDFSFTARAEELKDEQDAVVGDDDYIAPEIEADGIYSFRSDVYALGMIGQALLYGGAPEGPPYYPPSQIQPSYPISADTDRVLMRALDAEPAKRFADAGAFATALRKSDNVSPLVL